MVFGVIKRRTGRIANIVFLAPGTALRAGRLRHSYGSRPHHSISPAPLQPFRPLRSASAGNANTVARAILEKLPYTDRFVIARPLTHTQQRSDGLFTDARTGCSRVSYSQDRHLFHVVVSNGIVYLCMADDVRAPHSSLHRRCGAGVAACGASCPAAPRCAAAPLAQHSSEMASIRRAERWQIPPSVRSLAAGVWPTRSVFLPGGDQTQIRGRLWHRSLLGAPLSRRPARERPRIVAATPSAVRRRHAASLAPPERRRWRTLTTPSFLGCCTSRWSISPQTRVQTPSPGSRARLAR